MPDSLPPTIPEVTTGPLPASRKVHVAGTLHPQIRVAMREIDLSPSAKEPAVRVYDTSGPYTDPAQATDIRRGLPELRRAWIEARGDVQPHDGRAVRPEDNGLKPGETAQVPVFDRGTRRLLRARRGRVPSRGVGAMILGGLGRRVRRSQRTG